MATDNKQKVLIRSMSVEEIENYLCTSDLNGKITPKNEDTWHQNYGDVTATLSASSIIQNNSTLSKYLLFLNRKMQYNNGYMLDYFYFENFQVMRSNDFMTLFYSYSDRYIYLIPVFRPLIEYKE